MRFGDMQMLRHQSRQLLPRVAVAPWAILPRPTWRIAGYPCARFLKFFGCTTRATSAIARSPGRSAYRQRRWARSSTGPDSPASSGRCRQQPARRRWKPGSIRRRHLRTRPDRNPTGPLRIASCGARASPLDLLWQEFKAEHPDGYG